MSGRLMVVAPASMAAVHTSATKAGSERVASSHENSTSSTRGATYPTAHRASSSTSGGSSPSLRSMWIGLVARKMWMRVRPRAPASASTAASRSSSRVRARDAIVGRLTASPTARMPSKSPGEETAKPASITSTPRRSSARAISAFSSGDSAMPGDCSPSLSVVSKTVILRRLATSLLLLCGRPRAYQWCASVGVCARPVGA